jgi:hypothetical protein
MSALTELRERMRQLKFLIGSGTTTDEARDAAREELEIARMRLMELAQPVERKRL